MKLTDVRLKIIGDRAYLVRLNAKGKVTQKIECTETFNEEIVQHYDNIWLNHNGKSYLCAIREASKEQIAIYNIEKKAKKVINKRKGEKAFRKLQSMLSGIYSGYSNERMQILYEIARKI